MQASLIRDRVASVELFTHTVHLAAEPPLHYDALLLAPGARERKPNPYAALFTDRTGGQTYRGIIAQIDSGEISSLTLAEPAGPRWSLPLYELALLTAARAREKTLVLTSPRRGWTHSPGGRPFRCAPRGRRRRCSSTPGLDRGPHRCPTRAVQPRNPFYDSV